MIQMMEKTILQRYMEIVQQQKLRLVINPRMLVSHRRNPIEVNYEVLEVIGKGGYGEVKKVKHKELDVIRALKVIKKSRYKSQAELKMIKNEISIMKVVDHPNIVKLYEFFEDDENFYII
jgi:calcium-dependent protein kinase